MVCVWSEIGQTVCKAGNGFDDAALKQLQKQLRPHMKQIHKSYDKVPSWLDINRYQVLILL